MLKRGSIARLFDPTSMLWHEAVVITPNIAAPGSPKPFEPVVPTSPLVVHEYKDIKRKSDGVAFRMILAKVTGRTPQHLYNDHNSAKKTKRLKAYMFDVSAVQAQQIHKECDRVFGDRLVEIGRTKCAGRGYLAVGNDLFIRLKV